MALNEQEILRGVNQKDLKAWETLYASYYAALCSYADGIVKDSDTAQGYRSGYFDQDLEFRPDLSGYQRIDLVFISLDLQQCPVPFSYPGFPSEYFT